MGYVFLVGAIAAEVVATMSLRASDGFSKLGFTALVVVGYVMAFTLLSSALGKDIPLGVAYGVWAAAGVAAVALLSVPIFGESLTGLQLAGLALVIVGVISLEVGGAH